MSPTHPPTDANRAPSDRWLRRRRALRAAGGALPLLVSRAALAVTAVVPTDFATIQEAVDAVQGTPSALVRIDSDATFVETVRATQSVAIEAGSGFSPTIQGAGTDCHVARCTIELNPTSDVTPMAFAVRDVRMLPPVGADSGDRVLGTLNEGDADATVVVERIAIEDPTNSGAGGIAIRKIGAGVTDVTLTESSITLGGSAGFGSQAIVLPEEGSLTIEGLTLMMSGGVGTAFVIGGTTGTFTFSLTDSSVSVAGSSGFFTSDLGLLGRNVEATIARNVFRLDSNAQGGVSGFQMFADALGPSCSLHLDANSFIGTGPRIGEALDLSPFSGGTVTAVIANNVVRGMRSGFAFNAQSPDEPTDPGGVIEATVTNNTVHGAPESAIAIEVQDGTTTTLDLFNNLLTGSTTCGIELSVGEGTGSVALTADSNGLFANAGGDYCGVDPGANDVVADPLYVDAPNGDLHLGPGSPMIDAGNNAAPELPATDADGEPRIVGGIVDIGADEAPPPTCPNGTIDQDEECGEPGLPDCTTGQLCVECRCRVRGDCSVNGEVDLFDVLAQIDFVLDRFTPTATQVVVCDDDCDADIDLFDVLIGIDVVLERQSLPLMCP